MDRTIAYYVGLFLKIFSAMLFLPVAVGKVYGESFVQLESFILAAFISIVLGYLLQSFGESKKPDAIEGMIAATVGWILAVAIGGIPFMMMLGFSFPAAFLEAMSAFSTTGLSQVSNIAELPHSLLFWRVFAQWIGGLGILTFFVTVVVEAGGAATALLSAEANKTDSGSIRPSLFTALKSLWYVYIVFTSLQAVLLYAVGMSFFNAVLYALATMPTGGLASTAGGIGAFHSWSVEAIVTVFMVAGGTNFLLLYRIIVGDVRSLFQDYEFRLYIKVMAFAAVLISADLIINTGSSVVQAVRHAVFMTASVTSSTGFELQPVRTFPEVSRLLFFVLMFVGGSLGSTTGGVKMLRLGVLIKVVKREIQQFSLPNNALNLVMVGGRRIREDELTRITAIFFLWVLVILFGGIVTVAATDLSMVTALQAMTSSVGTMGPLFMSHETLVGLPALVKMLLAIGMLAGRLEMLPILVMLNVEIVKRIPS